MNDQEVTYSVLRFLRSPSESQNRLRPGSTQSPGKTDGKVFQYIQEKHQQEEILRNLSQKYHVMQNESYLKEQLLINKNLEYDMLKTKTLQQEKGLDLPPTKKKECHKQEEIFSKFWRNIGKLNEGHWCCTGVNCYYFTTESKDWKGCKQTCQSYSSSLLKIDDKEELVSWTVTHTFILLASASHPWAQDTEEMGEFRKRNLQLFFVLCLLSEQKLYS
uniref:Ly49-like N-terminal domain-containing protein n=1 Tax=Balaenoptera musculus TaxID=9771 RepID=A0A8C0CN32_BALMU